MSLTWGKAFLVVLLFSFTGFAGPLFGQEDEETGTPITSDWSGTQTSLYSRGDQIFRITLGMLIPLFFTNNSGVGMTNNIKLGGEGSLSYIYFLSPHIFAGAELQGSFAQTMAKKYIFLIPISAHVGYQFLLWRFEFPISISVGGVITQYDNKYNLFGFFLKPEASMFFRFNAEWSFGINAAWWFLPQASNEPAKDAAGHFFEVSASARYHF